VNGLVKSDEDDVALSMASSTWFGELTLNRLLLLEVDVARYRRLSGIISALREWRVDGGLDCEAAVLLIRQLGAKENAVGRRVIKRGLSRTNSMERCIGGSWES